MTEIEELIEQAEHVLANLPILDHITIVPMSCLRLNFRRGRVLYIEGYTEGLYIEGLEPLYREILW